MGWLGLGANVLGGLFGGSKKLPDALLPSYKTPGWSGDGGGVSKLIPNLATDQKQPSEPATEPEPPKEYKVDQWLGRNPGKIATGVAGGFLSDYRQRRNTKKHFKDLENKGLTNVEIAGGGGSGGQTVNSHGNTLGSGPATQVSSQLAFQGKQAELERANKREIARIQVEAPGRQATVAEGRGRREQELHPAKLKEAELNLKRMRTQIHTQKFDLKNKWPMKFASMGPENGLFALAAYDAGLNFESILTMRPGQDRKDVRELIDWYQKYKSFVGRETHGITEFIEWVGEKTGMLQKTKDGFQTLGTATEGARAVGRYMKGGGVPGMMYRKWKDDK